MFRLLALTLLMMTLCAPAPAEERRIVMAGSDFSFVLPKGLVERPVSWEAREAGVRCAAQNEQRTLFFGLVVRKADGRGDADVSALAARAEARKVLVEEPIRVDGCAFLLSAETVCGPGESVTFRMATAVHQGQRLLFFFVDRTGEYAAMPGQIARSFQSESSGAAILNRKEANQ